MQRDFWKQKADKAGLRKPVRGEHRICAFPDWQSELSFSART